MKEPAQSVMHFSASGDYLSRVQSIFAELSAMDDVTKVETINEIKRTLHAVSPFKNEPVDCVIWVACETVEANDYNPNSVAPPEMKLLEHSIMQDGFTQPIVTWPQEIGHVVIDGFHRNRVGKESKDVKSRILGYLPIVEIKESQTDRNDRIAATIRHNRARGKHKVDSMSDIVVELKKRNWSDERISKELGMDSDEILRLTQISGLQEMFANQDFSKSWEIGEVSEEQVVLQEPSDE